MQAGTTRGGLDSGTTRVLPRDDSGGPGFNPYTAEWADAGKTTGAKAHLSAGRKGQRR